MLGPKTVMRLSHVIIFKASPINFIRYISSVSYNFAPRQEVEQKEVTNFLHVKLGQ